MLEDRLQQFIEQEGLPADFLDCIHRYYTPIANNIIEHTKSGPDPLVIGIQGCQGSGKSTLAKILKTLLESNAGLTTAVLSIDDFYLTQAERKKLSEDVHPLLKTRGVPGTHNVALALKTISSLKYLSRGKSYKIPQFNKATDDRAPHRDWPSISGPVKVIILEGWCVGVQAQSKEALNTCVNNLESEADSDKTWRNYVNESLENNYAELFNHLDLLVVLAAPSFQCVYQWRLLQEQKLIEKNRLAETNADLTQTMSPEQIAQFVLHYQRISEHAAATLPQKADWLLSLNEDHKVTKLSCKTKE